MKHESIKGVRIYMFKIQYRMSFLMKTKEIKYKLSKVSFQNHASEFNYINTVKYVHE